MLTTGVSDNLCDDNHFALSSMTTDLGDRSILTGNPLMALMLLSFATATGQVVATANGRGDSARILEVSILVDEVSETYNNVC